MSGNSDEDGVAGLMTTWMRILDAGAGCGTVSRLLADQVGAQGEVVARDLHTCFCGRVTAHG
ncbi:MULTISPECIES: hypothetical protein [unclassified Streptomyces]|uniref:hypothetical protein n=1 Tax=unclassified Streptomyces TaxID=2593676 RepID=UPI00110FC41E|nr:hypothetical protein [Streptomyces sp. DASNCL29]TMU98118.1 hypothetical protein FGK60_09855 [Streptomyces sp. DASNCL29]